MRFIAQHLGGRLSRTLFWATVLFVLVVALIPQPPVITTEISDKVQHAAAFATLALLAAWAYPLVSAAWVILGLSALGAFIEVAQGTAIIHRDSDPLDWVADMVGCLLVLLALRWWTARKR